MKSFSSQLAFKVHDEEEFTEAIGSIREGIGRIGQPFDTALAHANLPDEIAEVGGIACIAEEAVKGQQLTVEGYSHGGTIYFYGVVESVLYPGTPSFQRYQYPSTLPQDVRDRATADSERVIRQIGLDWVPFNIEFFWDPDTGRLNLLEVNPRHSQSHAQMFEAVDGAPNHQVMAQLALGRDPRMPRREGEHAVAGKWFYRRFTNATVRHAPTDDEIAAVEEHNPGVRITVLPHDGMRLDELPDQDSYSFELAHLYIGARNEEDMQAKYDRCVAALPFEFDEVGGRT
ncbi:ATP-grasp domain-containing protein [Allosaccharopolyspora coralli]|uniref:ATP-grasp domain-containing protein n=1 Tax=Allosaccharopolyspora coralli TaxID=2665642 RepID=UPI001652389A|nr:ATP-grasp domain-containing protein [Allosaccharopolyspora coralli]